jgi:hypothetical protein
VTPGRTTRSPQVGASDRIAAFARATEVYAEGLEDPDLANVYWGKSLGLWQAFRILRADHCSGAERTGGGLVGADETRTRG